MLKTLNKLIYSAIVTLNSHYVPSKTVLIQKW